MEMEMGRAGGEIVMGLRKRLGLGSEMGWDRDWEKNRNGKHPSFCFSPSQAHEDPTGRGRIA